MTPPGHPPRSDAVAWLRLTLSQSRAQARRSLAAHGSDPEAAAAALGPLSADAQDRLSRSRNWLEGGPNRSVLTLADADYPSALLHSPDPPLALFLEGRRDQLHQPGFAIVGSRHPTAAGLETAREYAEWAAGAGWAVVSGLALGIDGAAHSGALKSGVTWAVLGTGLDQIYPPRHRALAARIAEHGLLISEHPPGTPPIPAHFPVRNRIIAGLSQACLVVEAALKSGSLVTARLASEANREVFAIPGSIRSLQSQGCHWLIQQGAKLVQCPQDILDEMPSPQTVMPSALPVDAPVLGSGPASDPVVVALGVDELGFDALHARLGGSVPELLGRLLSLELEGRIQRLPGDRFRRLARA
ncbi:DNA-processing protein DprA [Inhella gelatinilytica]|uniref:DNA-protecting protein DprA n=1 Tax=Inhella gelatinilytica TaxID=2795030 RepID=A0A931J232_9BURK|nr:DNA-processing protein DprA [Inhella gelatinilytica]MBH9553936.1 DNA-protecting protein DprA [Inhella gelatinilytica]